MTLHLYLFHPILELMRHQSHSTSSYRFDSFELILLFSYMSKLLKMLNVATTIQRRFVNASFVRSFSSIPTEPTLDTSLLQTTLAEHAADMSKSLIEKGFYASPHPFSILEKDMIKLLRQQSIELRNQGRFEQSWSERIDELGNVTRFDKEGVFACEPDGQDYDDAPDLIMYMSILLQTLPSILNSYLSKDSDQEHELSMSSFNAKLAVTLPGGSTYPLHIDNPQGLAANDIRKLTCILYLNPEYEEGDGGELRIYTNGNESIDVTPDGGRMVMFWSDEIPHEVLPTSLMDTSVAKDRYALTLWIPTENIQAFHSPSSRFASLGDAVFSSNSNTTT